MAMQHPDEKHLQLYVAARLDDAKVKIVEKHLTKCPQCTKRISELESSLQDPLLQKVKAAAASDDDSSGTVAAVVHSSPWNKSASNILPGDILGGNLRLEEKLGRGGMGETWKAYDQTAERFVVLKFVPGEMQHLKEAMDSVRSSFQKIHALQHQHICPVYSLVDDPKHGLYVVMKYIDGMTLSEYRRRLADKKTKLSFNDVVQILWAVAKGLDYAHEQKVIHRDIKPGNIMVGRKDGVQIIDFGLAEEIRTIMSQTSDSVSMSSSRTRPYMAPEQWQGRIQDARTDQYALAVNAYELFAGHVPFSGNDIELLKNTVLNDVPEPIENLPEHANTALLKALSKKRDERYENCKAFVKALAIKPEAPEETVISERIFSDGKISINDLPSDQASGGKVPPIWLPDGFSSTTKPPIIVRNTASSPKRPMPSWVMPTISALAMLVFCLIGFLVYVVLDRHPKPEKPIVVAKKPEPKEKPIVPPVPVQEEKTASEIDKPMENTQENIEPENVVDKESQPMSFPKEDMPKDVAQISPPTNEPEPLAINVNSDTETVKEKTQDNPVVVVETPRAEKEVEPVELVELRQKFEEAVKQAQTPYREELEKELALQKKQDKPELVTALEAELKHLDTEDATELSAFAPKKRSLFNVKVRYKKQMETARDTYLKGMDSLVKEIVRNARADDVAIVQNVIGRLRDRLDERNSLNAQKLSLIAPKRSQLAPVPVLRMTMELHVDGTGRCGASTGMSTDALDPVFPSTPFPLSAFPKAQAFRGTNGMGRVVFDFRNADSQTTWSASGWGHTLSGATIDTQRGTLRLESSKLDSSQPGPRASFWPGKFFDLPARITVEAVVNHKSYCPLIHFCLDSRLGEQYYVDLWRPANASPTDRLLRSGCTKFDPDGSKSRIGLPDTRIVDNQPVWSFFELPKTAIENVASVHCDVQAGHEQPNFPQRLDLDVDVVLIDISGKLKATTGLTVAQNNEKVTIKSVSSRTAAFRAGLKQGDEIVRFNGEKRSAEEIQMRLYAAQFGDPFTVVVIRNGEEKVFRFHAE